jgi:hypothetical protein
MIKRFKIWLINLLEKLLAWLKKEKTIIITDLNRIKTIEELNAGKAISDLQEGEKFVCHYCEKEFTLLSQNIFPTSVRLLYKDSYVTGKGVLCPHCGKTCITG